MFVGKEIKIGLYPQSYSPHFLRELWTVQCVTEDIFSVYLYIVSTQADQATTTLFG